MKDEGKDQYFIDTSVFLYTFDEQNAAKRRRAQYLVENALAEGTGSTSFQVVQETLNTLLRFNASIAVPDLKIYLRQVLSPLCKVYPSIELYELALNIKNSSLCTYYNALVVAGAVKAGCSTIYSEALQEMYIVDGLCIKDPFKPSYQVAEEAPMATYRVRCVN